MSTVGLVGLGNMGYAVAGRLRREFEVMAYDLDPHRRAVAVADHAVKATEQLTELATADRIVLSLPTPATSLVVAGELLPHLADGAIIIETSTVNPQDIWRLRDLCATRSVEVIDAAILSGVAQMAAGSSMLLVGGSGDTIAAVQPVLDALAPRMMRFGDVGSGMAAKVINNAVAHAVMVVLVEAGALANATGVSGTDLATLLTGPDAGLTRPLTHRYVERILRGDYEGGMPTEAARKDSTLALALAQNSEVPLFAIQAAHSVYELALAAGFARDDYAAIAKLWENWTGNSFNENSPPRSGENDE